jgi:hypothetical protein
MQRPTAEADNSPEPDALLVAMSDADFYRQARADIEGVREGLIPSIVAAQRQSPKDRPWGKRHKRRDRHGKAF